MHDFKCKISNNIKKDCDLNNMFWNENIEFVVSSYRKTRSSKLKACAISLYVS